jgi:hypothetical protein
MVLGMWLSKDFTLGKMIYYNDKKESKPSCGKGLEVQQPTNYIKGNGRKW